MYVPCIVYKLIYKTNSTSTKIYVYLIHVSARLTCHHQGVLLVAKVTPSKIDRCNLYSECIHTTLPGHNPCLGREVALYDHSNLEKTVEPPLTV